MNSDKIWENHGQTEPAQDPSPISLAQRVSRFALVKALQTLEETGQKVPLHGNPAFLPLFIVNPFSKEGLMTLFMTHPTTEDRIERLKALAQKNETAEALVSSGSTRSATR
jgi:hypothetical protein